MILEGLLANKLLIFSFASFLISLAGYPVCLDLAVFNAFISAFDSIAKRKGLTLNEQDEHCHQIYTREDNPLLNVPADALNETLKVLDPTGRRKFLRVLCSPVVLLAASSYQVWLPVMINAFFPQFAPVAGLVVTGPEIVDVFGKIIELGETVAEEGDVLLKPEFLPNLLNGGLKEKRVADQILGDLSEVAEQFGDVIDQDFVTFATGGLVSGFYANLLAASYPLLFRMLKDWAENEHKFNLNNITFRVSRTIF